jgi:acetyltransferase-like isoleucine patch superfamily enzyme
VAAPRLHERLALRSIQAWDRLRLAVLRARYPGLELDPLASTNLAAGRFVLAPGARVRVGPGVVTERIAGGLRVLVEEGGTLEIGAGTWLRTELGSLVLAVFAGATLRIGPECFLNACHLSAKRDVVLGRRAWVGPGTRVFDSDQHDFDAERPEQIAPVTIGDCAWIAADCTVLRGVRIGEHAVVGTRSIVTGDVAPHTLVFGQPARPRGTVGDRGRVR